MSEQVNYRRNKKVRVNLDLIVPQLSGIKPKMTPEKRQELDKYLEAIATILYEEVELK